MNEKKQDNLYTIYNSKNMQKVLSLKETEEWKKLWECLPPEQRDVYFTPEYYSLYEKIGLGEACCYVYENGSNIAIYPYLKNPISPLGYELDREYYDIQGVYGYNGVLSNSFDKGFIAEFEEGFCCYCAEHNIIAEFARINPLMDNLINYMSGYKRVYDRDNVYVDLRYSVDELMKKQYDNSKRKNIKKALSSGLDTYWKLGKDISDEEIDQFVAIYNHTMDRNNADEFYYFDFNYFKTIATKLGNNSLFIFVTLDNKIISCELSMFGTHIAYSFLGGTYSEYYPFRPNDLLKHRLIEALKSLNVEKFLLGGGSEGILRYKKTFSKDGVIPFYIAKRIHSQEIYDTIVGQWQTKYPDSYDNNKVKLLGYREI